MGDKRVKYGWLAVVVHWGGEGSSGASYGCWPEGRGEGHAEFKYVTIAQLLSKKVFLLDHVRNKNWDLLFAVNGGYIPLQVVIPYGDTHSLLRPGTFE